MKMVEWTTQYSQFLYICAFLYKILNLKKEYSLLRNAVDLAISSLHNSEL